MQENENSNAALLFNQRESDELESVPESELLDYLASLAPDIGWIIIYFNSLDNEISHYIREAIVRDPIQDDRIDVFLAGMMFSAKARALLDLYGQMIGSKNLAVDHEELRQIDVMLTDCSARRNEYAHADWIGMKSGGYVRVKSQSKRIGLNHRYKKYDIKRLKNDIQFIDEARHILAEFNERIYN